MGGIGRADSPLPVRRMTFATGAAGPAPTSHQWSAAVAGSNGQAWKQSSHQQLPGMHHALPKEAWLSLASAVATGAEMDQAGIQQVLRPLRAAAVQPASAASPSTATLQRTEQAVSVAAMEDAGLSGSYAPMPPAGRDESAPSAVQPGHSNTQHLGQEAPVQALHKEDCMLEEPLNDDHLLQGNVLGGPLQQVQASDQPWETEAVAQLACPQVLSKSSTAPITQAPSRTVEGQGLPTAAAAQGRATTLDFIGEVLGSPLEESPATPALPKHVQSPSSAAAGEDLEDPNLTPNEAPEEDMLMPPAAAAAAGDLEGSAIGSPGSEAAAIYMGGRGGEGDDASNRWEGSDSSESEDEDDGPGFGRLSLSLSGRSARMTASTRCAHACSISLFASMTMLLHYKQAAL